jgi:hypothetical protein
VSEGQGCGGGGERERKRGCERGRKGRGGTHHLYINIKNGWQLRKKTFSSIENVFFPPCGSCCPSCAGGMAIKKTFWGVKKTFSLVYSGIAASKLTKLIGFDTAHLTSFASQNSAGPGPCHALASSSAP